MDIIETIKSLLTSNHSDQQIVTALSSSSLQSGLQCAAVTALLLQTPGWGRHRGDLEPSGPGICCSLHPPPERETARTKRSADARRVSGPGACC